MPVSTGYTTSIQERPLYPRPDLEWYLVHSPLLGRIAEVLALDTASSVFSLSRFLGLAQAPSSLSRDFKKPRREVSRSECLPAASSPVRHERHISCWLYVLAVDHAAEGGADIS
jgi:hypothetical protein